MQGDFRMEYIKKVYERYHKASKKAKGHILDELCRVCEYNRKYAIWKLRYWHRGVKTSSGRKRGRPKRYGKEVLTVIEKVWEAAGYPWSVRLKAIVRLWLPWVKQHVPMRPEVQQLLLAMSASTMDRALKAKKHKLKRRLYGRTKPGTLLKHHIPVKTDSWDVKESGYVEIDLVSHSGPSAEGDYLHAVNLTDVQSTWVETRAVMGKGQSGVFEALKEMRGALPFRLLGLDSDNGSEFINHHLKRYCDEQSIQFTRSRPYKKNDNAHIEQKNWTHVRKLMGWNRYDTQAAREAMNAFYRNEYRLWMNLFQPSVKLVETQRIGSRVKRKYDAPQTPLDRLLASSLAKSPKVQTLKQLRAKLDPFILSEQVNQKLKAIWKLSFRVIQTPQAKPNELGVKGKQMLDQLTKIFGLPKDFQSQKKGKKTG
jgi:hypothetical protein